MYNLKIECVYLENRELFRTFVEKNNLWAHEEEIGARTSSMVITGMNLDGLKRLVDLLESEEFMRDDILPVS